VERGADGSWRAVGFDAFGAAAWIERLVAFAQAVLAQRRVRLVGVCFGHQIVARALGARIGRSERGWETSACAVQLTEAGRELFGKQALVRKPGACGGAGMGWGG
jgi:GMP synthase-like glutamine amidotransferase